jgi:hypothetical protein
MWGHDDNTPSPPPHFLAHPAVPPFSGLLKYPQNQTGFYTYVMRQANEQNKITPVEQETCCAGCLTSIKQVHCMQEIETLITHYVYYV